MRFAIHRFCALVWLAVVLTAAAATAQRPPGAFGETVDVELVNVEVWVTDARGNAVTGLTVDDFEVREDGRPVKVSYFDEVRGVGVPDLSIQPLAEPEAAPPAAGGAEEAAELGTPGYLVLYFDELFLGPSGRKRLIEDLRNFIEAQLVTPERILVLRQDEKLTVEAPLGSSRAELDAALAKLVTPSPRGVQTWADEKNALRRLQDKWEQLAVIGNQPQRLGDPCERFVLEAPLQVQLHAREVEVRIQETLSYLDKTANILAGLPGLKTLIYVSDGLTTTPGSNLLDYAKAICPGLQGERRLDFRMGMNEAFRRLTRHANANRVTLYAVQALGLRTQLSLSGADQRSVLRTTEAMSRYETASRAQQREGLTFLAAETGGRAILSVGKLDDELAQVAADMSGYYSLAYAPPHGGDGLEHEIKVRLRRSADRGRGLRVRHRPGYRDKSPDQRMSEHLESTLYLNLVANPLAVRLGAGQLRAGEGRKLTVPFHVIVPAERITFLPIQGAETARFKVQVMAQDERRDRIAFTQKVFQVPRPEAADQLISLTLDLELAQGVYLVAFAVRDEASQETSYVSTGIDLRPAAETSTEGAGT